MEFKNNNSTTVNEEARNLGNIAKLTKTKTQSTQNLTFKPDLTSAPNI